MKKSILLLCLLVLTVTIYSQKYPEPEFTNEVYYLKKDSGTVTRLEKNSSKRESKTKMGGLGGMESGYLIEGEKSPIRLAAGKDLSFVFSTGASATTTTPDPQRDSMLRANGVDPAMMEGMGQMNDPANTISLYKTEKDKEGRKIIMQKSPGMMPFGSKKIKSSDKYTFSVRKIREGYWELVIDKNLPKGEYAFTVMNFMNPDAATGNTLLFAFGID